MQSSETGPAPAPENQALAAGPSRRLEIVCAVIAIAGSALLVIAAQQIEVRNETGGIDPRWWPTVLGAAALTFGVVLAAVAVLRPPFSRDDLESATRVGWVRLVVSLAIAVVYLVLWPLTGYLIATLPMLVVLTWLFGGRGWRTLAVFPVAMTGFTYALFHLVLKVPL
ncbi:tripartite tricarboxylate transporter TctB family protein [Ruania alba]|uniref:Tripartite tricarboxylate transporter TctB family protein n=1 Tax=Ruania alba TaxID=648782 RepID=A0A1H5KI99_9MICO|nr:tripartite tricarboxylate transporter TctB family protein [Ruania alba]SEE64344.1 Tripartite tricarboxylate transporter TctB family protein [Ruania alba]